MKSRFSTVDITVVIRELLRFVSMRVMNVYDVDNKTYLIRLGKPDDKAVIVLESGIKLHSTEFDWPKNPAPSGFSMKMRKHLKGRRLESVRQLGIDRIVDMAFGSGEAAYHVILELYDRGNIILTDYAYTILNILRPRTDTCQDVRFAVRETYPVDSAKQHELPTEEKLYNMIVSAKEGDMLKKILIPHLDYGPAIIEHCLIGAGIPENAKIGKGFDMTKDMGKLLIAIEEAEDLLNILQTQPCKGYITQKAEKRPATQDGESSELLTYNEFHPMLFRQFENKKYLEFETFNKAVDQFYSQVESQKIELKTLQQERTAMKKLENIKKDHEKRLEGLQNEQETDKRKGQLIEMNLGIVDRAILIVRSAIANQIDWTEIKNIVKEAQVAGDPVAMAIKDLSLDTNHFTMLLQNPYVDSDFEDDEEDIIKPMKVDIDLGLSAYANSRKYFEMKKHAAVKEQKTLDASTKALKSAERKTKETLKEVATAASINKARKTYWFEKFLWFITSENYLVVGGRDQQQNELIVKRYMNQGDIYVHADLHGASSVVIKNPTGEPVPPKTLNEAGTMAICNSAAWDAKVVTSAWWVYPSQVSKTAPSGEYLTTGSFMIRGKKNYLPPSYLIYGFAVLFKLEESSVFRHAGERKIRVAEEDEMSVADSIATESEVTIEANSDHELEISDDDDSDNEEKDENDVENKRERKEMAVEGTNTSDSDENYDKMEETEPNVKNELEVTKDMCDCESASAENGEDQKEDIVTTESAITTSEVCDIQGEKRTKNVIKVKEERVKDNESAAKEVEFPDTEISLQHIKGDKYELLRSQSSSSQGDSDVIHLGDNVPVVLGEQAAQSGAKLSAKQRRELKKAKKQQQLGSQKEEDEEDKVSWLAEEEGRKRGKRSQREEREVHHTGQTQIQNPPPKRGQKAKMKKMKEKYKDQDEEERQLRMEILASAGSKKEDKKKGKKGQDKAPEQPKSAKAQLQQQQQQKKKIDPQDVILQDIKELKVEDAKEEVKKTEKAEKKMVEEEVKEEEEEKPVTDDGDILNSLTGIPVPEDELLYAITVCAPYNALTNYKYKVKLLPGSTKRGKAAKTALNMFMFDKNITSREKDLLKILKDVDMSRNIPGKVKVTAPNLHKAKKK